MPTIETRRYRINWVAGLLWCCAIGVTAFLAWVFDDVVSFLRVMAS